MARPVLTLAMDAAWGGLGWSVSTPGKTLAWGVARPSGAHQWARASVLVEELLEVVERCAPRGELGDAYDLRVVVERAALKHRGVRGKGDPRVVVRAMSELVGGVSLTLVFQGAMGPWLVEPEEWRAWWGIRGTRAACKASAVALASAVAPGLRERSRAGEALVEDAAEAILLGRGAADRPHLAPKQPTRCPSNVVKVWGLVCSG